MPLVDTLAFFFWTGLSAIKIVFAVPLLYVRRSSTNRRIHRINASAEYGMVEAAKPPSDDQKEAPAADADDPRMWGAYDRRMDQLARKWIFPLAALSYMDLTQINKAGRALNMTKLGLKYIRTYDVAPLLQPTCYAYVGICEPHTNGSGDDNSEGMRPSIVVAFRGTDSLLQLLIEFARTIVECVIKLASFGLFDPKIGSPLIDNSCSGGGAGDDDGNVNIYFMDMFTRLWLSRPSATIRPAGPEPQSASAAAAQVILHKHKNKQQQRKGEGEEEANGTEADAPSSMMTTMMAEVRELARKYPSYQILVTGHSLGGSFAAIAAAFIARDILPSPAERRWRLQLMTFGQPRTGDRQWAEAMNKTITQMYRVVDGVDFVPHVPPTTCGITDYYHHNDEVWYPYTMFHSAMFTTSGAEDDKVGSNTEFRLLPFVRDRLLFIAPFVNNVLDHTIYFGLPILGFGLWTKIELQQYE